MKKISLDPGNMLTQKQKDGFVAAITKYADIFKKQPGHYNNRYGEVDNSIVFSQTPPRNDKIYSPNYSMEQKQILTQTGLSWSTQSAWSNKSMSNNKAKYAHL